MRAKTVIPLSLLICLALSCAGRSKVGTGGEAGDPGQAGAALMAPVPSVINIPAEIKTGFIEKLINEQMPKTLYRSDTFTVGGFSNVKVTVSKNGRVKMQAHGDELRYALPLKISMRFSFTISALGLSHTEYQDVDAGITINLRSKIHLKNNWRVASKTTADGYSWTSDPVVKIRMLTIPVKPVADRLVSTQMGAIGEAIDRALPGAIDAKAMITPLWEELQTPVEISIPNMSDRLWLRFDPTDVYMSQPAGKGGVVTASAGIRAAAVMSAGGRPDAPKPRPLPDFKTPERPDSSFAINLYPELSFEQATAIAREALTGKTFKSGLQKVTVRGIEVSGAGGGLVMLKMELSGSLKGTVRVTGKAVYSERAQTLSLTDFDFDAETDSRYQKARNWLLKGIIMAKMRPLMKFPLKDMLGDAGTAVREMLAGYELYGGRLVLHGKIDTLRVTGVEVSESGIRAAASASGSAVVRVKDNSP